MAVKKGDVYKCEIYVKAPNTDNITMQGDPIPAGCVVEIQYISICDETTSSKTVRLGYGRSGTNYWTRQEPAATNFHGIESAPSIILVENEYPIGMVESPTANDEIRFYCRGIYL